LPTPVAQDRATANRRKEIDMTVAADTPTIVFVHGAWADATGFGGVIRILRERGFAAVGAANPLRHLTGDAAYVADLLRSISGPLVLVGHSYGGAVITNAATGNEQVQALVYLNGLMPDEGETIQQLIESELSAGSLVQAAIRPVPLENPDGGDGVDLYLDRDAFKEAFAADVDDETAFVMAATQRPWSGAALATPSGPPAWRSIPSWYLLGAEDRVIPAAAQRFMAERANARIEEVAASHASFVSQPDAVSRLILSAVEATSRTAAVSV
jgi:pimeloyl-ACP methyl ester carboxylesterase